MQDGLDGGGFCHSIVVPVLERCLDTRNTFMAVQPNSKNIDTIMTLFV